MAESLKQARQRIGYAKARRGNLDEEFTVLDGHLDTIDASLAAAIAERDALLAQVADLQAQLAAGGGTSDPALEARVVELEQEVADLKASYDELSALYTSRGAELTQAHEDLAAAQARIQELEDLLVIVEPVPPAPLPDAPEVESLFGLPTVGTLWQAAPVAMAIAMVHGFEQGNLAERGDADTVLDVEEEEFKQLPGASITFTEAEAKQHLTQTPVLDLIQLMRTRVGQGLPAQGAGDAPEAPTFDVVLGQAMYAARSLWQITLDAVVAAFVDGVIGGRAGFSIELRRLDATSETDLGDGVITPERIDEFETFAAASVAEVPERAFFDAWVNHQLVEPVRVMVGTAMDAVGLPPHPLGMSYFKSDADVEVGPTPEPEPEPLIAPAVQGEITAQTATSATLRYTWDAVAGAEKYGWWAQRQNGEGRTKVQGETTSLSLMHDRSKETSISPYKVCVWAIRGAETGPEGCAIVDIPVKA